MKQLRKVNISRIQYFFQYFTVVLYQLEINAYQTQTGKIIDAKIQLSQYHC